MAIDDTKSLKKFLSVFLAEVQQTALWLREFVWKLYPHCNELIYDNYNALAFGWSPTERQGQVLCSIAIGRSSYNIHFGFYGSPRFLILKKDCSAKETSAVMFWLLTKPISRRHISRSW